MNATDTISGVPEHAGRCAGDIMYLIRCCALLWQEEHGMVKHLLRNQRYKR